MATLVEVFFSPEVLVLFFATMIDAINVLLVCVGLDDFGLTDLIGLFFIGGWLWFRSMLKETPSKMPTPKRQKLPKPEGAKATRRMRWLRIICFGGELIPYVGALPWWTILVFSELKSD